MVTASQRGLSLIELLVGLVILSVLTSLAAPSFSRILTEQRLRQASNELRISMVTARAEAIKRGETVVVLPRAQNWEQGWCVAPGAATTSCGDDPIQEFVSSNANTVAVAVDGAIRFSAWGRASGCPQLALSAQAAGGHCQICLSVTTDGRVVTEAGACGGACPDSGNDLAWTGGCQ